jgi:hypothetical protein
MYLSLQSPVVVVVVIQKKRTRHVNLTELPPPLAGFSPSLPLPFSSMYKLYTAAAVE